MTVEAAVFNTVLAALGRLQVMGTKPDLSPTFDLTSILRDLFGSREGAPRGGKATCTVGVSSTFPGRCRHRAVECIEALRTGLSSHPTFSSCFPYCSQAGFCFSELGFLSFFVLGSWSQRQKAVCYLLSHTACERKGCLCWAR